MDHPEIYTHKQAFNASKEYFNGDELAAKVFVDKYALRDGKKNLLEPTPDYMHRRIARELAKIESEKFKNPLSAEQIFEYLDHFKRIIPQGSLMYGVGNTYQIVSLSNCYVIQSTPDSYGGICKSDEEIVQISKRRGGSGVDISFLRPDGTATTNAARTSTGIESFLQRFSNAAREVGQGGRRGALMVSLSVHHPEILKFAKVKRNLTKVTGANISVRLSDEFLNAVDKNEQYEQRWPVDSKKPKISRMVNARNVWRQIIENAHAMAEPGLLFWDNIIRESPADCYSEFGFKTVSTNPCVTSDTWVLTNNGPKRVVDLIGKKFIAVIDGNLYDSTNDGFFLTGTNKNLLLIETKEGYCLKCTPEHKIKVIEFVNRKKRQKWVEAKNLQSGDDISLGNHKGFTWKGEGTKEEGWLIGSLLGDGVFCENTSKLTYWGENKFEMLEEATSLAKQSFNCRSDIGTASANSTNVINRDLVSIKCKALSETSQKYGLEKNKDLLKTIEEKSSDFYKGFLSGWFDADGTVLNQKKKGFYAVRLSSVKLENLVIAQRMLHRLGMASTIYKDRKKAGPRELPDGKGGYAFYECNANHELQVTKDNLKEFSSLIGFRDKNKQNKLDDIISSFTRGPYKTAFTGKIKSVTKVENEDVYDCTIPEISEFDANGIQVHNCAELPLSEFDSCRLLLLNVFSYVKNPFMSNSYFDYEEFTADAKIAQRLMDDIVDLELEHIERIINKIEADPEEDDIKHRELTIWKKIYKTCKAGRRTGTGVTAIGDTLAALGIPYGSRKGINAVEKIYKTLKLACYRSSVDMAKELGPFSVWDAKLERKNPFLLRIKEEDPVLYKDMQICGRRNIGINTTAPAGSVSILTQTTSGIEPLYEVGYKRRKKINPNDKNVRVDFIDKSGDAWEEFRVYHAKVKDWMNIMGKENAEGSPWEGSCAYDIDWKNRIKLQAAATKHIDHSISSTINLPEDVTVETVASIYEIAWKSGCKGITVYRKGSRDGVLIDDTNGCSVDNENTIQTHNAPKRPKELPCDIHHLTVLGKGYLVFVGLLSGYPYEVFAKENGQLPRSTKFGVIKKVKRGQYKAIIEGGKYVIENIMEGGGAMEEAVTRLTSASLRHGADISFIVHQLEKAHGDFLSFEKAIARALKKYVKDGTEVTGEGCEECGNDELIRENGCKICKNCGWTACS